MNSTILKIKNANCIQLRVYSTELIKFLMNNSFVLGNKIRYKEALPKWVFTKKEFIYGALRGLLDTDGGIYHKQRRYYRVIIEFQTKSPYIRRDIYKMLKKLNFNASKSSVNVRIQKQEEVKRFISVIGCANPKNIIRCRHFITTGKIPLKENLYKEIANLKVSKPFKAALV